MKQDKLKLEQCLGVDNFLGENLPRTRTLSLYNYQSTSDISYYPLDSTADRLGFDFGIEIWALAAVPGPYVGPRRAAGCEILKNYVEQKQQTLTTLHSTLSKGLTQQPVSSPNKHCVIL